MNAGEQLAEGQIQVQGQAGQQQEFQEQALQKQAKPLDRVATATGQATWKSASTLSGLEKALDALFKAHDHLNIAADQGGDGLSKMIDGIGLNLRGLQRELSQLIYRLKNGG
jgi:type VI protein secretion system component VasK